MGVQPLPPPRRHPDRGFPDQAGGPCTPAARCSISRSAAFGADLFADPVWDMMLDLLAARLEGRAVRTSSLCIAAGVPTTSALRWIRELTERGLFVRVPDPNDRRGVLIELSDEAAERLMEHLAAGVQGPPA